MSLEEAQGSQPTDGTTGPAQMGAVCLAGLVIEPMSADQQLAKIVERAIRGSERPLAVSFIDIDMVFRARRREFSRDSSVDWVLLPGSAEVLARVEKLVQLPADPAGPNLVGRLLERLSDTGIRVGVLTTDRATADEWAERLAGLGVLCAGSWVLGSDTAIPAALRNASTQMLLLDVGARESERWLVRNAATAGVSVAIVLPGTRSERVLGVSAVLRRMVVAHALSTHGHAVPPEMTKAAGMAQAPRGCFVPAGEPAEVCAVAVTYGSANHLETFIDSLRVQAADHRIRLVIADNDSADGTLELLAGHPDIVLINTGGNLGYAGALNVARRHLHPCEAVLVLNPDLVLGSGAITRLLGRLKSNGGGAVVPRILDDCGALQYSLRREPTWLRAFGDGVLGSALPGRPAWSSELVLIDESYHAAMPVDWATGAALLVDAATERTVGEWDERFFLYSEEVDYCRRVRETGRQVWYEPTAVAWHHGGGSSSSPALIALLAVNRVRYVEKWRGPIAGFGYRFPVAIGELRRGFVPAHLASAAFALGLRRRHLLPRGDTLLDNRGGPSV